MKSLNKVQLIGNLGRDPEVKFTGAGKAVCSVSVATSESWRDKETQEVVEKTEWHRVVAFGRLAEIMGEYLHKGSKIYAEGQLQTRKWENKEGVTQYTTEVVIRDMMMLDGKGESKPRQEKPKAPPVPQDDFEDDIPF